MLFHGRRGFLLPDTLGSVQDFKLQDKGNHGKWDIATSLGHGGTVSLLTKCMLQARGALGVTADDRGASGARLGKLHGVLTSAVS